MKHLNVLVVVVLALALMGCAGEKQEQAQAEAEKVTVGQEITAEEATPVATILETPADYLGKTVVVEGEVGGRCAGTGCWVSLDGSPDDGLVVRSVDHSFVFPEECVGEKIRVQGVVKMMDMGGEEHDHDKEEAEGEDHECPNPQYYVEPLGMEMMPAKQA